MTTSLSNITVQTDQAVTNYTDEKLSIIILSNDGDFNVRKYSSEVTDIFLKNKLKSPANKPDYLKDKPTIKLRPDLLKKYEGSYQFGAETGSIGFVKDGRKTVTGIMVSGRRLKNL